MASPPDSGPLRDAVTQSAGPGGLLEFFRRLLVLSYEQHTAYLAWERTDQTYGRHEMNLTNLLAAALTADPSWTSQATTPPWAAIDAVLSGDAESSNPLPVVGLARCVAAAVHKAARDAGLSLAVLYFARRAVDDQPVQRGELIYRGVVADLRTFYGTGVSSQQEVRLSTKPARLRYWPDESPVPEFGLAMSPLFERFKVYLDYESQPLINEVFDTRTWTGRVAVGVPNATRDEYVTPPPEQSPARGERVFRGTRPSPPDQAHRVLRLIRRAVERQSAIILLPELCVPPGMGADELRAAFEGLDHTCLLVAGSRHDVAGFCHPLVGWLVRARAGEVAEMVPVVHKKFNPYIGPAGGAASAREVTDRSDWDPAERPDRPAVRIHCGTSFRVATLICADAMCPEVAELLVECSANVALVPAMSETHGVFDHLAERLVHAQQGLTLVALTPTAGGPSAMIRTPHRDTQALWVGRMSTRSQGTFLHRDVPYAPRSFPDTLVVPAVCEFFLPDLTVVWDGV